MLSVQIEATGRTMSDIEDAIEEAKERIMSNFIQGFDRNEDGSYVFDVDGTDEGDEPRVGIGELTARLGRPDHDQEAVFAWTGETYPGHTWTEDEVQELIEAWNADAARIAAERADR